MQALATVFGGSGFIGRYVVRALARDGWRIRVAMRRPHLAPELRVMGDVGQIELVQANARVASSVEQALDGADAVVNLVGLLYERGPQKFNALHVDAARTLAAASARAGVDQFVQMSALGADAASPSKYAVTKAEGEAAVRAAFAKATIVRPSVVFGPEDKFFNKFAAMAAMAPALPLIGGGATKFQPVYAGDVGAAIAAILKTPAAAGRTYELGGPGVYSFKELLEMILRETGYRRFLAPIPFPLAKLLGTLGDIQGAVIPYAPPITSDQVELLKADNVVDPSAPGLAELGIEPTAVEAVVTRYLWRFRQGGQFAQPETGNAA